MKIVYVDGHKIRQNLDTDFNILHFNSKKASSLDSKWYIPEGEIWFDYNFKDEEEFLTSVEMADIKDPNRKAYIDRFCKKEKAPDFVVKEEKIGEITVKYVNGKIVREYIDPQFVMGGHDLVYEYIPTNEVWIDNKLDPKDIPHILAHEIYERELMNQGKSYDIAHDYATAKEKESRRASGGFYPGDANRSKEFEIKDFYIQL